MSREVFQKEDLITVGEVWGANPKNEKLYSNPDGSEISMVFQFEHICLDQQPGKEKWDLAALPLQENWKEIELLYSNYEPRKDAAIYRPYKARIREKMF